MNISIYLSSCFCIVEGQGVCSHLVFDPDLHPRGALGRYPPRGPGRTLYLYSYLTVGPDIRLFYPACLYLASILIYSAPIRHTGPVSFWQTNLSSCTLNLYLHLNVLQKYLLLNLVGVKKFANILVLCSAFPRIFRISLDTLCSVIFRSCTTTITNPDSTDISTSTSSKSPVIVLCENYYPDAEN